MKTIYLIRHAKSSWSDPSLQDFDRPLNSRGNRDVKMMTSILSNKTKNIDLILTSKAKRALATTEVITNGNGVNYKEIIKEDRLYQASSKKISKLISKQNNKFDSLAIVAHNPGLTELANELGGVKIDNLPTTGILAFKFDTEKWANITKKDGKLLFFEYPKLHKAKKVR